MHQGNGREPDTEDLDTEDLDTEDMDATRRLDPDPDADGPDPVAAVDALKQGSVVGRYRIGRPLGHGGMGTVYQAEQLEPVRRTVAIKLLRGQRFDALQRAYFDVERQTLAQMQHPAIAQIFDAGTTEDGVPYFAMEFIEGERITTACARAGLGLEERLALLAEVCDGVQHAHQKGVIHRDLKPGNILVAQIDGRPRPKIIDFGIAMAATRVGAAESAIRERAGTPDYMSPEQVEGDLHAIDTRSDVYSLGIVLYELLTGGRPGLPSDSGRTLRPSATTLRPPSASIGAAGGVGVELSRRRRGRQEELDRIVLKAIDRDRARRYASAGELAEELRRFLAHQPLRAMAPTRRYLVAKFVRRHRFSLAAAGAVMLALVSGLLLSLYGLDQAQAQRNLAEARGQELEQVVAFQQAMLQGVDVRAMGEGMLSEQRAQLERQPQGESLVADFERVAEAISATDLARSVLDRFVLQQAMLTLERDFADQPMLAADLRWTIGEVHFAIGQFAEAEADYRAVLEARLGGLGERDAGIIEAMVGLGAALERQGRYEDARPVLERALALARAHLPPGHPVTDQASLQMAQLWTAQGEFAAARDLQQALLADMSLRLPPTDESIASVRNNLGITLVRLGDLVAARAEFESLVQARKQHLGLRHPDTLASMSNLAAVLGVSGEFEAALAQQRQLHQLHTETVGSEHPLTLNELNNIGSTLVQLERLAEARATLSRVAAIRSRVLGVDHPQTLRSQQNLASVLERLGESEAALAAQKEVLAARRRTLGPDHPDALLSQESLASMHRRAGRLGAAGREAQAALAARERVLGADHPQTRNSRFQLADILADAGQLQRAQTLLSGLVDQQRSGGSADNEATYRYALRLYQVHAARGDYADAQALRRELLEPLLARDPDSLGAALRRQRTEVQVALTEVPGTEGADGAVAGAD